MAWLTHRPIGLTFRDTGMYEGYTLFSSVRGHHATLIDEQGLIVHQWHHEEGIQHIKLLDNGHLLIQTLPPKDAGGAEKIGGSSGALIELDWQGNTVWQHRDVMMHHDYVRLPNGNTLYLAWDKLPEAINSKISGAHHHEEDPEVMWGDLLREVSPDGEIVSEWYSWEHLDPEVDTLCPLESYKEWTHCNSIEVLDNGDRLISFRLTSWVAIIDGGSGEIKWRWGKDELSHQHHAQMLSNGNVLIFDNGCHRKRGPGFSRVVEVNPNTDEIEWRYFNPTMLAFYSFMVSGCERLPNGNTLITEGASGRLFEVTKDHEVVWEYISPWTLPSSFGPTPAVFRSYRIARNDPRLAGCTFNKTDYEKINAEIADGVVQREPDYTHHIPDRK